MSAALYTSRANLKTLVIGKDDGALTKADRIENYFGMAGAISGCELVENTKKQARTLGAELMEDEIFHISRNGGFRLEGRKASMKRRPSCWLPEPRERPRISRDFRSWKAVASATVRSATHSFIVAGRWASWEMRTMPSMNLASFCL